MTFFFSCFFLSPLVVLFLHDFYLVNVAHIFQHSLQVPFHLTLIISREQKKKTKTKISAVTWISMLNKIKNQYKTMNELNTGIEVITKIYNNKKTDDRYTSAVCFTNIHFVLLNCLCIVLFFLSFFFGISRVDECWCCSFPSSLFCNRTRVYRSYVSLF